jgi:DNA-binding transcriptional regulator YhcF (GntR family)
MEDRLFKPTYIPFFLVLRKEPFKFATNTMIVYGFIVFYLKHTKAIDFYFTDDQMGVMLDMNPKDVQKALKILSRTKLIYRFTKFNNKTNKRNRFITLDLEKHTQIAGGYIPQVVVSHIPQTVAINKNKNKIINKEKLKISEKELIDFLDGKSESDSLPLYW